MAPTTAVCSRIGVILLRSIVIVYTYKVNMSLQADINFASENMRYPTVCKQPCFPSMPDPALLIVNGLEL